MPILKTVRIAAITGVFTLACALSAEPGFLSVTDFGAVPNDGNDDLVAVQKCVEAATQARKACFIPEGKYLLAGDLWLGSNAVLFGEGDKSALTFPKGKIRALKNGNKHFYYTRNYNNERIAGKVNRGVLEKAVQKGGTSFSVKTEDEFKVGDWIFISNNRKDTWTILEKQSKGKDTAAHLNGSKDILAKAQIARVTEREGDRVTVDRELDSGYPAGAVVGNHVGARNIRIHDLSIVNHSEKGHAVVFEQPFNAQFRALTIRTTKGAGGIRLVHYAFRCVIEKCNITNSGQYAVTISNFSSENRVVGNQIVFIEGGDCAILIMMYSKDNLVSKNTVNCLSKVAQNEGGIYIHATSFDNQVLDNTIHGASSAIGAFYGANNNLFKGNSGLNPNTGISLWYAGGNNLFEENEFRFGDTRRPGQHKGVYVYCSQVSAVDRNRFSGKLDVGCMAGPKANCAIKNTKPNAYTIALTGLGFDGGISLDANTFKSTTKSFVERKLE
jgi:hypothetical protein